jgi:hypothetical protein
MTRRRVSRLLPPLLPATPVRCTDTESHQPRTCLQVDQLVDFRDRAIEMEQGWLAMWNPIIGQKVRWQPTQPGWGRLRVPKGVAVVLAARFGGKDARFAHRCPDCATVVVPPDSTYDQPAN